MLDAIDIRKTQEQFIPEDGKVHNEAEMNRVHLFNVRLQWLIMIGLVLQATALSGFSYGLTVLLYVGSLSVITTIVYLIRFNQWFKGLIIGSSSMVSMILMMVATGGASHLFLALYITLMMVGLYFKVSLIVAYALLSNIVMGVFYSIQPAMVLPASDVRSFLSHLVLYNVAIVVLYTIAKWGNEHITAAKASQDDAEASAKQIAELFDVLKQSTLTMNSDLDGLRTSTTSLSDVSESINTASSEMASAITEEAMSLQQLHTRTRENNDHLNEIKTASDEIATKAHESVALMETNDQQLDETTKQMQTITDTVGLVNTNMHTLNSHLDGIDTIFEGLSTISSQTQLLALNASIEAARAGEQGKGFAVVANEVRKLSEMSAANVHQASALIADIKRTKDETLNQVVSGKQATETGMALISNVSDGVKKTGSFISRMHELMDAESHNINSLSISFTSMEQQLEDISAIAEEQAASIQEVQATIEEETSQIKHIDDAVKHLAETSARLAKHVENVD